MSDAARSAAVDAGIVRRHDLDAVRAFAMLLGIALHAALAFVPFAWIVQDSRPNELYGLLLAIVHGFRMPLFFLVSGYFTAMLWRRRGLGGLLKQRALRIGLPLLLGLMTVVPAINVVSAWAMGTAGSGAAPAEDTLIGAVRAGNIAAIRRQLDAGADINEPDAQLKTTPLAWAALRGDVDAARLLLDRGAKLDARSGDGSTPLHSAAFLGRAGVVKLLLDRGADPAAKTTAGATPMESTTLDWGITQMVAGMVKVDPGSEEAMATARAEVRSVLAPHLPADAAKPAAPSKGMLDRAADAYHGWLNSETFQIKGADGTFHLVYTPVFHHLWFLWFLCWLVPLFVAAAWVIQRLGIQAVPRWLVNSWVRFAWLIPLTLLPQIFMGATGPSFGPDTSAGLIPLPHLLAYYGIFFAFGAMYFDAKDDEGVLGRHWPWLLTGALVLAFPLGIGAMGDRLVGGVGQVAYAWGMSVAMIGLFRRVIWRPSAAVRYMSDASYWLYLTHLPLVIWAQAMVRDWPLPSLLKLTLICVFVVGVLLAAYEWLVRYTWVGAILNGRRKRAQSKAQRDVPVASMPAVEVEATTG